MKDSHFAIGMAKGGNMAPAPYKQSNPDGADRPPVIDSNKLGRESWTLGTFPDTFKTVN